MTFRSRLSSRSIPVLRNSLNRLRNFGVVALLSLSVSGQAAAQSSTFSLATVPVLTIVPDRLYSDSKFGQRLASEIAARGRQLAAENRRIEAELEAEETELTALRDTLSPEEFRDLANAFDEKVTTARVEQDEKARRLSLTSDQVQRAFVVAIAPVLEDIMSQKGASVVLDRRAVFASADASDVTQEAIQSIDLALGEGRSIEELIAPTAAPESATPDQ